MAAFIKICERKIWKYKKKKMAKTQNLHTHFKQIHIQIIKYIYRIVTQCEESSVA